MGEWIQYFLSSDLNFPLRIKLCKLQGLPPIDKFVQIASLNYCPATSSESWEIYLSLQLINMGKPVGFPVNSSLRSVEEGSAIWQQWITFPVKIRDLAHGAEIELFSILIEKSKSRDTESVLSILANEKFPLFDEKERLKQGVFRIPLGSSDRTENSELKRRHRRISLLESRLNEYSLKNLEKSEWMDRLLLLQVEREAEAYTMYSNSIMRNMGQKNDMHVIVELPTIGLTVINHTESVIAQNLNSSTERGQKSNVSTLLTEFHDPEVNFANPVDNMLYLAYRNLDIDYKVFKPSVEERNRIQLILESPSRNLSFSEKELLRNFRFSLIDNPKALSKFLRCIHWDDTSDVEQGIRMIKEWTNIGVMDALELLSPDFENEFVRDYAVQQLQHASNAELQLLLPQLIQAMKFDSRSSDSQNSSSILAAFLNERCSQEKNLCNLFHWYLRVEMEDPKHGSKFSLFRQSFLEYLIQKKDIAAFKRWQVKQQETLVEELLIITGMLKSAKKKVDKSREYLIKILESEKKHLGQPEVPIPNPLKPEQNLYGIIPAECSIFKSAKVPLKLTFNLEENAENKNVAVLMFKSGDDIRQDQLVIQMINLMDDILKKVQLDLRLTPYRVLATSTQDGFIELIGNSHNVSSILKDYGEANDKNPIGLFLDKHNPKPSSKGAALENFVRSSAGYSVITYLLGIGDRHLDNILVRTSGHLFHIDFGFIFGKDPKPFPAKIRLIEEMILAMGGVGSPHYQEFRKLCCSAFNIFRKNASLILNLLWLMKDSGIDAFKIDVEKTMSKVEEKFRLDLDDEEADRFMIAIIDESVGSIFPAFFEMVHRIATDLR